MEKLQIIPFRARHVREICPEAPDAMIEVAQIAQDGPGEAFTACCLGQPIGAGGCTIVRPGMAEVWTLLSPLLKSYPIFLHRECRKRIALVIQKYDLRRLQATVDPDDDTAVLWIERLGFTLEGYMREYSDDGRDQLLYSLTKEDKAFHVKLKEAA